MNSIYKEFYLNPDYDVLTENLFGLPFFTMIKTGFKAVTDGVYHCSNERLNAYFKDLNLKNSRVATVGSSGDQVLNSIFYGSKDITLIDANMFTRAYVEYKIAMIKNLDFKTFKQCLGRFAMFNWKTYAKISHDLSKKTQQFFDELMLNQDDNNHYYDEGFLTDSLIRNNLLHTPCDKFDLPEENIFYNNKTDYNKLKKLLIENDFKIKFIVADVSEFHTKLKGKFDYIFLSNIYDYVNIVEMFHIIKSLYKKINAGGAIQYHYSFNPNHPKENLISKLAKFKSIQPPICSKEKTHHVYFLEKPYKQENDEFIL